MEHYKVGINLKEYTEQMVTFIERYIQSQGCVGGSIYWKKIREEVNGEMLRIIKKDIGRTEDKDV